MSHSKRTVLLVFVAAIAMSLWGCQAADPLKVPLATTAVPDDTAYMLPSLILEGKVPEQWELNLNEENPTKKLTLGGIACTVKVETPAKIPDFGLLPGKLLIQTPTQEFTFNLPDGINANDRSLLMALTLDNGRKYLLEAGGCSQFVTDPKPPKRSVGSANFSGGSFIF
ncbi:MAG: hypothetical protein FWD61_07215 [Phycisphaerales bacterium]|nr:hypothetical protein [Phycisphaerales bacterium]